MTNFHHGMTAGDAAAMKSLRAQMAAHPITITRASYDGLFEHVPPAEGIDYSEASVGNVPGVWCVAGPRNTTAMLYLHGGAFVFGSARAYRRFVGHIVARSGVPAFVADYRLAPEHPFPAALDDARAVYRALVDQLGASHVAVVGDSAGGGLALSLLREETGAGCGVLLSPWTDLTLTGESLDSKAGDDPLLTRAGLAAGAEQYLGTHSRRDPRVSPLYASSREARPIQVHVGTAEVLLDDSLRLDAGDQIEVHTWEGMPHVFPSSIGVFEAAQEALALIGAFLRKNLPA